MYSDVRASNASGVTRPWAMASLVRPEPALAMTDCHAVLLCDGSLKSSTNSCGSASAFGTTKRYHRLHEGCLRKQFFW